MESPEKKGGLEIEKERQKTKLENKEADLFNCQRTKSTMKNSANGVKEEVCLDLFRYFIDVF
jgi:hypothetical protein